MLQGAEIVKEPFFKMRPTPHLLSLAALLLSTLTLSAQYQSIDRHARRAPSDLSENLPALAEYLAAPAETETERARAFFTWVVSYLQYDKAAARKGKRINQSIRDILQRRRGLCMDYARLFKALCGYGGLRCEIVDGYAKIKLREEKLPREANHSWNAVYADGQWRLLDATWAGTADELSNRFKTSYFFTPPEYFVLNHLPQQPMWQLLPCPVSAEQFTRSVPQVQAYLSRVDSCTAYTDSIRYQLRLSPAAQQLRKMRQAYDFHPSVDNQEQLAHAMLDYAVHLDEQTEALALTDSTAALMPLQQQAIRIAREAAEWVELQDWQQQFLARLHINHAIALYQAAEVTDEQRLTRALQYANEGLRWLEKLPEDHYYRNYAKRQNDQLLEQLHYLLDR